MCEVVCALAFVDRSSNASLCSESSTKQLQFCHPGKNTSDVPCSFLFFSLYSLIMASETEVKYCEEKVFFFNRLTK